MLNNILKFKCKSKAELNRKYISKILYKLAEDIKNNNLLNEPHGIIMILISSKGNEILNAGINKEEALSAGKAVIKKYNKGRIMS
jgi:hypothetical protein